MYLAAFSMRIVFHIFSMKFPRERLAREVFQLIHKNES